MDEQQSTNTAFLLVCRAHVSFATTAESLVNDTKCHVCGQDAFVLAPKQSLFGDEILSITVKEDVKDMFYTPPWGETVWTEYIVTVELRRHGEIQLIRRSVRETERRIVRKEAD